MAGAPLHSTSTTRSSAVMHPSPGRTTSTSVDSPTTTGKPSELPRSSALLRPNRASAAGFANRMEPVASTMTTPSARRSTIERKRLCSDRRSRRRSAWVRSRSISGGCCLLARRVNSIQCGASAKGDLTFSSIHDRRGAVTNYKVRAWNSTASLASIRMTTPMLRRLVSGCERCVHPDSS